MSTIFIVWIFLLLIFSGVPGFYYLYLRRVKSKPWKLKIDKTHTPPVTIIIPTHNEEKMIGFKLENLYNVIYPKEKMQIILIDDASTDNTIKEASKFVDRNPKLDVKILNETKHRGKARALNLALKYAKNDIIIISDADTFWAADILIKALPYLADPSVGAVIGREKVLNSEQSWVTQTEKIYFDLTYEVIRLGQSKIHSTIIFHGGFGAYKRDFLSEFNLETDDSGTALDIVQKGARTLLIPEAICFDVFPVTWKGKISTKVRRASQLVQIYTKCLKLLIKRQLALPKKIAMPEIFLYIFNPIVFLLLMFTMSLLILEHLPYSVFFPLILLPALVRPKSRILLIEVIQNNCILLSALFALILRKKFIVWNVQEESRLLLTRDMLERESLI